MGSGEVFMRIIGFEEQAEQFRALGYPDELGVSGLDALVRDCKASIGRAVASPDTNSEDIHVIPTLLVVSAPGVSLKQKIAKVTVDGRSGTTFMTCDKVVLAPGVEIPAAPAAYPIYNVFARSFRNAAELNDWCHKHKGGYRRGLTIDEMICYCLQCPDVLREKDLAALGSVCMDDHLPIIFLDRGEPTLGCFLPRGPLNPRWAFLFCNAK